MRFNKEVFRSHLLQFPRGTGPLQCLYCQPGKLFASGTFGVIDLKVGKRALISEPPRRLPLIYGRRSAYDWVNDDICVGI